MNLTRELREMSCKNFFTDKWEIHISDEHSFFNLMFHFTVSYIFAIKIEILFENCGFIAKSCGNLLKLIFANRFIKHLYILTIVLGGAVRQIMSRKRHPGFIKGYLGKRPSTKKIMPQTTLK